MKDVEIPILDFRKGSYTKIPKSVPARYPEINLPLSVGDVEGKTFVSQILVDVFESGKSESKVTPLSAEEQEFIKLIDTLELAFSSVDSEKTEESIKNAGDRWEECLKKTNGDIEKAREVYDQL